MKKTFKVTWTAYSTLTDNITVDEKDIPLLKEDLKELLLENIHNPNLCYECSENVVLEDIVIEKTNDVEFYEISEDE